jgi:Clostripain family
MNISSTRRPAPLVRPAAQAPVAPATKGEKEWTVLFYNAGHNDEAKMCTYSLDRLETVGSDENTNLVVMNHRRRWVGDQLLGRFAQYDGTKTHYVTKTEPEAQPLWEKALPEDAQVLSILARSGPHKIDSPVIQEHPDNPNMGDPATLKKFILDNMKRFPAKRFAVVLSGHGAAFQGQMIVHSPEGRMSNDQLGEVFEQVTAETGRKIDLLNMNTCFSANMESVFPLRNSADAIVASESTVFAATQPLAEGVSDLQQAIREGHDVDGKQFAKLVVERARRQPLGNLLTPTLSALDPGAFKPLAESVKNLQDTLMEQRVEPALLKKCLEESVKFNYSSIPRDINVTDLGSFAHNVAKNIDNKASQEAAQTVVENLTRCVLAEQHAEHSKESLSTKGLRLLLGAETKLDGATGLTIYYDHDVNNDSRLHKIEGSEYAETNKPGEFMRYISQATEAEREALPAYQKKLKGLAETHSKWKRRTSAKIPIPKALDVAETVAMTAASIATFSTLSKMGIPAGDVLFGTYFTGRGAYDIGTGAVGLAKNISSGDFSPAKKEEMIDQGAKVAIGACMGAFGLSMLGLVPDSVAWPVCLGALGTRVGKEVVKLAVRKPEFNYHRNEAKEYDASSAAEKLAL